MGRKLIFGLVILGVFFLTFHHSDTATPSVPSPETSTTASETFSGNDCTGNCSGHEAGYNWAEEHSIDDEDACDTAGDRSNSPSFAEGCKAYVNGESSPTGDDKDDDDKGDDKDDQSRLLISSRLVSA